MLSISQSWLRRRWARGWSAWRTPGAGRCPRRWRAWCGSRRCHATWCRPHRCRSRFPCRPPRSRWCRTRRCRAGRRPCPPAWSCGQWVTRAGSPSQGGCCWWGPSWRRSRTRTSRWCWWAEGPRGHSPWSCRDGQRSRCRGGPLEINDRLNNFCVARFVLQRLRLLRNRRNKNWCARKPH